MHANSREIPEDPTGSDRPGVNWFSHFQGAGANADNLLSERLAPTGINSQDQRSKRMISATGLRVTGPNFPSG